MSWNHRSPIYALVLGCAVLIGSPLHSAQAEPAGTSLWEARWQHVRLIPRDGGGPNGHPVSLAKADIRNGLAQLRLDTGDGEPVELLTTDERAFVAEQLSKALARATPDQDVSIATIGMRKTILGLNEPRLTTMRAFMGADGLNVIFGEAQAEPPNDTGTYQKVDPRLVTILEGRRETPARVNQRWKILSATSTGITLRRSDWAAIPAAAMTVPEPGTEAAQKQAQTQMEDMQRQMQQMQQQIKAAPAAPAPAAAPSAPSAPSPTVEDRLRTLDQLKAKGLLSPKEYAAKRRQIIDSF